jgi:hypothetical protein
MGALIAAVAARAALLDPQTITRAVAAKVASLVTHPAVHTRHQTVRAPCLSKHLDIVGTTKRRHPAINVIATADRRRTQSSTAPRSPSPDRLLAVWAPALAYRAAAIGRGCG